MFFLKFIRQQKALETDGGRACSTGGFVKVGRHFKNCEKMQRLSHFLTSELHCKAFLAQKCELTVGLLAL